MGKSVAAFFSRWLTGRPVTTGMIDSCVGEGSRRGALSRRAMATPSLGAFMPYIMQPTSIIFGWNINIAELYLQIHWTSHSNWLQRSILYEQITVSSPDKVNTNNEVKLVLPPDGQHQTYVHPPMESSPSQGGRGFIGWTDAPQPKRTLFTLWYSSEQKFRSPMTRYDGISFRIRSSSILRSPSLAPTHIREPLNLAPAREEN